MNRSTFCEIKYTNGLFLFKGQVYDRGWFKKMARTPVPKLPQSYPPPPETALLNVIS